MRLRKGMIIRFKAMDDLTGHEVELSGKIIGDWKKIKQNYPEEMGGIDENSDVFLVDVFHRGERYVVYETEIIKDLGRAHQ